MLRGVLAGDEGPAKDIVVLNAGATLYAAGVAPDLPDGLARARQAIESGAAQAKLEQVVALAQQLARAA